MSECKFCNVEDIYRGTQEHHETPIDFGVFGSYTLSATVCEGKYQITIDNAFTDYLISANIPIKYCPFCGREMEPIGNMPVQMKVTN